MILNVRYWNLLREEISKQFFKTPSANVDSESTSFEVKGRICLELSLRYTVNIFKGLLIIG